MRKLYLVGYDIAANGRRYRLLAGLRPYAQSGQKSAYECRLENGWLDGCPRHIPADVRLQN